MVSNMLVKDGGIRGVVIKISDSFNHFEINENQVVAILEQAFYHR